VSDTNIPAALRNALSHKAGRILFDLHRIADLTRDGAPDDHRHRRDLHDAVADAVEETLALCATATDQRLTPVDLRHYAHEIMTGGSAGYEFAAYCLGLIEETTRQRAQRELAELLTAIEKLIEFSRGEARSRICELLEPYGDDRRPLLQKLVAITDEVTNIRVHDSDWPLYQHQVRYLIQRLRETYLNGFIK
jgi:hypothetical protein